MSDTTWWTYVERLIGTDTAQDAARRAGFDKSAFTRWKKGAKADPEFAVKLARAYGANVLEALVAAGVITEEEAALREVNPSKADILASITDVELAEEQKRRADQGPIRFYADMSRSDVEAELERAVQAGLFAKMPSAEGVDLALRLSKESGLRSDFGLAARRSGQRKGADPAGLDDGEE